jgi:histidine triad (HIT) family protein
MPTIHAILSTLRLVIAAARAGDYSTRKGRAAAPPGGMTFMMSDNLFQKIIDRQIKADIVYEDDRCLAFRDINPQAPVHVLVIPRKVIATHDAITEEDRELLGHLHLVAAKLAGQLGLKEGYRIVVNCREQAGQTVPHLHLHLLGGRAMHWPPG